MMDVGLHNEIDRLKQELLKREAERDAMAEEVVGMLRVLRGRRIDDDVVRMVRSALLQDNNE